MLIERVYTSPEPYEPFLLSQGIKVGNLLFISGQAGYGEDGRIVTKNFREQGEQAFANLERAVPAKLLAVFVVDTEDDALTTPDHVGGSK
jgi:enamine deaminase RidA (YjgF/YER057c/UK114 family)